MPLKDLASQFPTDLDIAYKQYKESRRVADIMSKDVAKIKSEATMDEAAKVMGKKHIGSLVVVKKGKPVGIVTERDLLTYVLGPGKKMKDVTVESVMSSPLISVSPLDSIKEAARTMLRKKGRLAVFECGKLVGIVTASDLVRSFPETPETMLKVDDFMTKRVVTSDGNTTISTLVRMMGEKRIGSVIITSKGKPKGIFTERDLLTKFLTEGKSLNVPAIEAATSPIVKAPTGTSIHEAAFIMASKHIRRLPITKDGKIFGIITARDLVEAYAK